jgi:hypothetical protein
MIQIQARCDLNQWMLPTNQKMCLISSSIAEWSEYLMGVDSHAWRYIPASHPFGQIRPSCTYQKETPFAIGRMSIYSIVWSAWSFVTQDYQIFSCRSSANHLVKTVSVAKFLVVVSICCSHVTREKGTVNDWRQGILHTFHSIIIKYHILHMRGAEFRQIFMWWAGTVKLLSVSTNLTIRLSTNGSGIWLQELWILPPGCKEGMR